MLVIPRGPARSFRAVARKCMAGRPRGPAPPVAAEVRAGTLTLTAVVGGVGLSHVGPADGPDGRWDVPMAVFEAVDRADGPVELEMGEGGRGVARWTVGGVPRTLPFDVPPLDHLSHRPIPPADWHPVPTGFLTALHECGRTTAREVSARYSLSRVQVRGGPGTVVGSDGRTALIWTGFDLPFEGDV